MLIVIKLIAAVAILATLVVFFFYIERARLSRKYKTREDVDAMIAGRISINPWLKDAYDITKLRKASQIHWGFAPLQIITITNLLSDIISSHVSWASILSLIIVPVLAYFQGSIIAAYGFAIRQLELRGTSAT